MLSNRVSLSNTSHGVLRTFNWLDTIFRIHHLTDRKVSLSGGRSFASLGHWHLSCSLSYSFPFYIQKKKKNHPWLRDLCGFCLQNLINTFMKRVVIYFRSWENKRPIPVLQFTLCGVTIGLCSASFTLALFILAALWGWKELAVA